MAASKYTGKVEEFLEEYLVTEEGRGTVVFGGRDAELKCLDDWLADDRAPPRFILVAPAGRGKSALLIHWMERLRLAGRLGDAEGSWRLVFFPISMRFSTHLPKVFYEALAARLNEVVRGELKPPAPGSDPATHYEDQCRQLLDAAITQSIPILIVVDGVDEALGGRFGVKWFPRAAGPLLRLLVSARLQIGGSGPCGWIERFGWSAGVRVQTRELPILEYTGVRDLLFKSGAPVDVLSYRPDVIKRLYELTGGEPLLLRLYVEDLWKRGDQTVRLQVHDLGDIEPGFGGYFRDWLERQREAWEEEQREGAKLDETTLQAYLAVLACAYGRLNAEEISEITRRVHDVTPAFRLENALHPLRRFIVGMDRRSPNENAGYVLSHPKLGEFLREDYFDRYRIEQTRQAFMDWGYDILRKLNNRRLLPEKAPAYLLQYLGQHLQDADAPETDFMCLVEEGWLRGWEAFEGGHRGFAEDVRKAANIIAKGSGEHFPKLAGQLRCQLVLTSIRSSNSVVPSELIIECVRHGLLPPRQALHWVEYQDSEWDRARALTSLAPLLPETLLREALGTAQDIGDAPPRVEALVAVAMYLPSSEQAVVLHEALRVARDIRNPKDRAPALAALAPFLLEMHLSEVQRTKVLSEVMEAIPSVDIPFSRMQLLVQLAPHLPAVLLKDALAIAKKVKDPVFQAQALRTLAPHLPAVLLKDALATAKKMDDSGNQAQALRALAPYLPKALLGEALQIVRAIKIEELFGQRSRAQALAALAPHLPKAERAELLGEALQVARGIRDEWSPTHGNWVRAEALLALAPHLPETCLTEMQRGQVLGEALQAVQGMAYDLSKAQALAALAPYMPKTLLMQALRVARDIRNPQDRAHALAALTTCLPDTQRIKVIGEAVQVARESDDDWTRARTLSEVVPHLPEALFSEALDIAQGIVDDKPWAEVLAALAPYLPQALLSEALGAGREIGDGDARAEALVALAQHLPDSERTEVFGEALQITRSVKSKSRKARALRRLAPYLSDPERTKVLAEALLAVRGIADKFHRDFGLVELAADLPEADQREALRAFQHFAPHMRIHLLAELAPRLPKALLSEAVQVVRNIPGSDQSGALASLAPHLPYTLLREILEIARHIEKNEDRARALGTVALYLPETERIAVISEAVQVAQTSVSQRTEALAALAPHLSEALLSDTLQLIAEDDTLSALSRAEALASLAPHLPNTLLTRALKIAADISRDGEQAKALEALEALAPHLPEALLSQALKVARAFRYMDRARALTRLARYLPEPERVAVFEEGLRIVHADGERARMLASFVQHMPQSLQKKTFGSFLSSAGRLSRSELLALLPKFFPIIGRNEGVPGLHEIRRTICDVGKWFP